MRQDLVRELALQITGLPPLPAARPRPERFLARLGAARAFQAAQRRLPNPAAADPAEAELGDWLRTQRTRARTGSITRQERALLEDGLGRHWDDPVARDRADTASSPATRPSPPATGTRPARSCPGPRGTSTTGRAPNGAPSSTGPGPTASKGSGPSCAAHP
ncbi:hypothetical protein [Sinomonas soli]